MPAFAGRATKEGWGLSFGRTALARFAKGRREMTLEICSALTCPMGVTDMAASIAWYERVMGCDLLYRDAELAWSDLATPRAGGILRLRQVGSVGQGGGET